MLPFIKLNEIESAILQKEDIPQVVKKEELIVEEKPSEEVIDLSLPDDEPIVEQKSIVEPKPIEKKVPIPVKKPFTLFPKDPELDYGKMIFDFGKYAAPIILGLKVM
jgi:hypothetical protein